MYDPLQPVWNWNSKIALNNIYLFGGISLSNFMQSDFFLVRIIISKRHFIIN